MAPIARADRPLPAEPRSATRVDLDLVIGVGTDHNFFVGLAENISEGGVFVATHEVRAIGTRLVIELQLPSHSGKIRATCEVRWTRVYDDASDAPPGMGLMFLDLAEPDAIVIRGFVEQRAPLFWE